MSSNQVPQPATTNTEGDKFPVAAIICIAIGAYVVVIAIILLIRQILLKRGICSEGCSVCGKEAQLGCCECCIGCGEACNCCANRSIESCLDSICPSRRQMDCADIIMCKCCSEQANDCCSSEEPLCDCGNCDCTCQAPDCGVINCFCCEINCDKTRFDDEDYDHGYPNRGYPNQGYPGQGYPPPQPGPSYSQYPPHQSASYPPYPHGGASPQRLQPPNPEPQGRAAQS